MNEEVGVKYRNIENSVLQGITQQLWKWSFSMNGSAKSGQAATKAEAANEAKRAIDRALAPKKLRLVRPEGELTFCCAF